MLDSQINQMDISEDAYFQRVDSILPKEWGKQESILIVGVGSGGSRTAAEVIRLGVGHMILLDRPGENLEPHNLVRHVLGRSYLYKNKAESMKLYLQDINPYCDITVVHKDVVKDNIEEEIQQSTQILLCTDNEQSKHVINRIAVKYKVPFIVAGVYDGGIGGEVAVVQPGGPCYGCMCSYINRSVQTFDEKSIKQDYNSSPIIKTTAALNIDIAQISLIQARLSLMLIEQKHKEIDLPGNFFLFGNRPVSGLFPRMLHNEIWKVPIDPKCLICSQKECLKKYEDEVENILAQVNG